jgi:hypothetical protein
MPKTFSRQDCALLLEAFGWNSQNSKSENKIETLGSTKKGAFTIEHLRGMLAPFVLRRLKENVLDQLMSKNNWQPWSHCKCLKNKIWLSKFSL